MIEGEAPLLLGGKLCVISGAAGLRGTGLAIARELGPDNIGSTASLPA